MDEQTVNGLAANIKQYLKQQGIDQANVTITYAENKACASIEVLPKIDDKDRKIID